MSVNNDGWIGVDFDGTLATYPPPKGQKLGNPISPMVTRVKTWLKQGRNIRILTARAASPAALPYINEWCLAHLGVVLPITDKKDYDMIELWDDRAIAVECNTGLVLGSRFQGRQDE